MTRSTHATHDRVSSRRVRFALPVLALVAVLPMQSVADAEPVTRTFTCTGGSQTFNVPGGVTSVDVVAVGAPGGTLSAGPGTGGRGAQVSGTIAVTPGTTLSVLVGCPANGDIGGFNGGGTANETDDPVAGAGGGGASDVRTTLGSLASRRLVAAGGGGEGGSAVQGSSTGGTGGNAGANGGSAATTTNSGGRAGTLTAGGAGGSASGAAFSSQTTPPRAGGPGTEGRGGNGGAPGSSIPARGGGGGGGGLFGGGGGGGGGVLNGLSRGGGGGGGGSSLVPSGGTIAVAPAGTPPSVTISYLPPLPGCSDGLDNDGDSLTDFPDDQGCADAGDSSEVDPPANDAFEDAEVLTGSADTATGSNVEATVQPGEPDHSGNASHSIWYRWTASGAGATTVELCGSDFDTVLAVYTGTAVTDLTLVAEDDDSGDDACGGLNTRLTFEAIGGVTYHIAVDGFDDETGNVTLSLNRVSGNPTVTVEQAAGQDDPTMTSPVTFTVTFSEPVSGFAASDVDLSASTVGGALSAAVTDTGGGTTYMIEVSGFNTAGTVVVSILAEAASDDVGNLSEASTSDDNEVTIDKLPQAITFGPLAGRPLSDSPVSVTATASSGLPVTFTTTTPEVCSAGGDNGATITLVSIGACTVQADQAGDTTFAAAPAVMQSFEVAKNSQTITFNTLPSQTLDDSPVTVSATTTSGLPPTFTTTTPAVCTSGGDNGATITLVTLGTCTVQADQAGDATFAAAPAVMQSFEVSESAADLSVAKTCSPNPVIPGQTTTCTVTVANAGPGDAADVVVTDDLPQGLTLEGSPSGTGGFTCTPAASGPEVRCAAPTLASGASAVITVVARASVDLGPEVSLTNTATVTSSTDDPDADNNSASARVATPTCTIDRRGATPGQGPIPVTITGSPGNDVICGSPFDDLIQGREGNDVIFGLGGNDGADGEAGNDRVFGGVGDDLVNGGVGDDTIVGNAGNDVANGGEGRDVCAAERRLSCEG